jgi:hypothetical protein
MFPAPFSHVDHVETPSDCVMRRVSVAAYSVPAGTVEAAGLDPATPESMWDANVAIGSP